MLYKDNKEWKINNIPLPECPICKGDGKPRVNIGKYCLCILHSYVCAKVLTFAQLGIGGQCDCKEKYDQIRIS